MTTTSESTERLRAAGLRVTAPRLAVLDALDGLPHAPADVVFARVALGLPGTSLQAVYGVLAALTGAGLVRRIEPAGSAALYELRTGDNHHHVVCTVKPESFEGVRHGAWPTTQSTSAMLPQTVQTTWWWLSPVRSS
jgi:Fe2+ or Zn2+ uptake regulation protein